MANEKPLKFKEFNYEEARKLLPEEYEPLPYLPGTVKLNRQREICIHGFLSEEEALQVVKQYGPLFPKYTFSLAKAPENIGGYELIAPYELSSLIPQDDRIYSTVVVKKTPYNNSVIPPILYRTIGAENVDALFERGELLISTFKRCRVLENDARRDKYELRNIVEIREGEKTATMDIGFDDSLLVLCTSLPPISEDTGCSGTIKITNVFEFCKEITITLAEMGLYVVEVMYGQCVYNDKVISIETDSFLTHIEKRMQEVGFPSSEIGEFILANAENDIIMNKPSEFFKENEYRFVWKLSSSFDTEKLIIKNQNLSKYCERLSD